jgi:hypothetical protein
LTQANRVFNWLTVGAVAATSTKIGMSMTYLSVPVLEKGLGIAAVGFPVLAVGALSWAVAQGYEARVKPVLRNGLLSARAARDIAVGNRAADLLPTPPGNRAASAGGDGRVVRPPDLSKCNLRP